MRRHTAQRRFNQWIVGGVLILAGLPAALAGDATPEKKSDAKLGRELFVREWVPNDSRSHGGDGLGPVFNDSSCVACHNLGAVGGAGPANKNVDIVSAFANPVQQVEDVSIGGLLFDAFFGGRPRMAKPLPKDTAKRQAEELARIHPGFKSARSVVLHRFGTTANYDNWRANLSGLGQFGFSQVQEGSELEEAKAAPTAQEVVEADSELSRSTAMGRAETIRQTIQMTSFRSAGMSSQHGNFLLTTSQRNTTALFGVGLIDSIPDKVLEAAAGTKHAGFPKVSGRVSRLKDGKIGRFGWKAQKATLREFAMTACAVELGLNVPEHEQAGLALKPEYKSPGFDMDQAECDALVGFLKELPAPVQREPVGEAETKAVHNGRELFAKVGCATCHTPKLGDVDGIYSDLLVHNMGQELGDTGSYGVFLPDSADESTDPIPDFTQNSLQPEEDLEPDPKKKIIGATRLEWRTPPLWGFRDSGPYLHDGRADTLDQAIAFHGGEAALSTQRFFALKPKQRLEVVTFLKSLVAPAN